MKTIQLKNSNATVKINDCDFELVSRFKWILKKAKDGRSYAHAFDKKSGKIIMMHRMILGLPPRKPMVDHRNSDGLDNRRRNIRVCTRAQNAWNSRKVSLKNKHSKYKGVSGARDGVWRAQIAQLGHVFDLGYYRSEIEAASAFDSACLFLRGGFARTNFSGSKPEAPDKILAAAIKANNHTYRKRSVGVSTMKQAPGWFRAYISFSQKQKHLGIFPTFKEAKDYRDSVVEMLKSGVSIEEIKRIKPTKIGRRMAEIAKSLGHASTKTTEGYVKSL